MQILDAVFLTLLGVLVLIGRVLATGSRTTQPSDPNRLAQSGQGG